MAGSAEKGGARAQRGALAHGAEGVEKDTFAHTIPLISIWLPMLVVVGLVILAGVTTSHVALGGALVALLLATYAVVNGVVRLANLPPEQDDEESATAGPPSRAEQQRGGGAEPAGSADQPSA